MNDRESLESFLCQFNRNQKWAGLFTFAMTALGLFVVMGLIGLTVWGFASYESARRSLSDTSQQLEVSHKKIGELESIANSNTSKAELMKLRDELSNTQQLVAAKDAEIATLKTQLDSSGASTPSTQSPVSPDCTKCQSTVDQQIKQIQELQDHNKVLTERLNNCPELMKRCRNIGAGSSVVNKPVVVQ